MNLLQHVRYFVRGLGLAFLTSSIMTTLVQNVDAQYPYAVGEVHADFEFPSIEDGKPVKLSDLRGKKVLVVHFASW